MGLTCGLVIAVVAMIWHQNLYLGLVVGLAMVTAITVAACMGVVVTAFFKKVGIDPQSLPAHLSRLSTISVVY